MAIVSVKGYTPAIGNSERHVASKNEANMRYNRGQFITVGQPPVNPGRALEVVATVAGNITVQKLDGTTESMPVAVGLTILPYAITAVTASTATASYQVLI